MPLRIDLDSSLLRLLGRRTQGAGRSSSLSHPGATASILVVSGLLVGCAHPARSQQPRSAPPSTSASVTRIQSLQTPTDAALPRPELLADSQERFEQESAPPADPTPPAESNPPVYSFQTVLPTPEQLALGSPAVHHANLSPRQCMKMLSQRRLPFQRVSKPAPGVAAPVRLAGPLRGIRFRGPPASSPFGIMDCRLLLSLDAFAEVLSGYEVKEVHWGNSYRPKARLAGSRTPSQHRHALAIDIAAFTLRSGETVYVETAWESHIGQAPCGPEARLDTPTEASIWLRNLVCDSARAAVFHHMLTGNFDAPHKTHFHFDIQRGLTRVLVR